MGNYDQLDRSTSSASTTRRTLLKGFAAAGAAVSLSSKSRLGRRRNRLLGERSAK